MPLTGSFIAIRGLVPAWNSVPLASNSETASEHDARLSPGLCDLMLEGSVIHGPEHAALLGEVLVDALHRSLASLRQPYRGHGP